MTVKARIGDVKRVVVSSDPFNGDIKSSDVRGLLRSRSFGEVPCPVGIDVPVSPLNDGTVELWTLHDAGGIDYPCEPGNNNNYLVVAECNSGSIIAFRGLIIREQLMPWERNPKPESFSYSLYRLALSQPPVFIDSGEHESRSPFHGKPSGADGDERGDWLKDQG